MYKRLMDTEKDIWNYDLRLLIGDIKKLLINIHHYTVERPDMIVYYLRHYWAGVVYFVQSVIDPLPPMRRNEDFDKYLDRINPKYGLRYFTKLRTDSLGGEIKATFEQIDSQFANPIDRKFWKDSVMTIIEYENYVEENYNRYLTRKKIFESK